MDERSFCLLRSMVRTWLISREIAKWSRSTRRLCDHRTWRLPPEQQPAYHDDQWRSRSWLYPHHGGHLHSNDNPTRSINAPVPRYGRQDDTTEWWIRAPVDDRRRVWWSAFIDYLCEPILHDWSVRQYHEEGSEAGQSSLIRSVLHLVCVTLYRFRVHNVPTDQVVLINAGSTTQEITIPRGAYDIDTIIAMLNTSDALFDVVIQFLIEIYVLCE